MWIFFKHYTLQTLGREIQLQIITLEPNMGREIEVRITALDIHIMENHKWLSTNSLPHSVDSEDVKSQVLCIERED